MYSHGLLHGGLQAATYHFLLWKIGPNLICQTVQLWIWSQPTILIIHIIHTKTILPNQFNCEWNLIIVLLFFQIFVGMFVWFIVVVVVIVCGHTFLSTNSKFQHHRKNDVPGQTYMLPLSLHMYHGHYYYLFFCFPFFYFLARYGDKWFSRTWVCWWSHSSNLNV